MTESGSTPEPKKDDLASFGAYEQDLRDAERKIAGEIDPGGRAVVVAVCVLVALVSLVLPHAGGSKGLDVLTLAGDGDDIALPSTIFVYLLLIFGVGFSMLALVTRRWVLAWIALCGSAVASVVGMFAIWTRNTVGVDSVGTPPAGAGIGLILGWITMIVLTFHWSRAVWARTNYHLALEAERRDKAAEREARGRALQRPVETDTAD